ncbi:hypothetical protein [Parasitella parasitica]|uniref:Ndc10 domain-containing protein n=1 Tax=Parasitella parasitica TaxID=35722 RepID=A0A0B7N8F9_9FUNG|nr:hypothetical protein [Parasitella parasitica]
MKVKQTKRSNDQSHRGPGRPKKVVMIDAVEEREASTSTATAPNCLASSRVTDAAPQNQAGTHKLVEVPIGIEPVKQYRKALMFLHEYQRWRQSIEWASSKDCERTLILASLLGCSRHSGYLLVEQVYGRCSPISARHHMLLQDQDMRNLKFADCFATIIPRQQHQGREQAVGMVFCLDKGKNLKEGEVKFACEPTWHNYKVTRGRLDPEKGLSGSQQYNKSKDVFLQHEIYSTRITHGGHHAGTMEAESLGIPFDIIKRGGGWKDRLGRLEIHYLGKLPSEFTRGMAGFWQKPFFLKRNQVSPPLGLQRQTFPWLETIYGESNEEWLKTCENEMMEIDENDDQDDDVQVILQDAVILIAAGRGAPLDHDPVNAAFNYFTSAVLFQLHQLSSQQEALMTQQQSLLESAIVPSAPSHQQLVPLQPAPSNNTSTPTTSCSSTPQPTQSHRKNKGKASKNGCV